MRITERQRRLIGRLDQIVYRKKTSGVPGYFLGVEECTNAVNSLIAKGIVEPTDDRKALRRTGLMPDV